MLVRDILNILTYQKTVNNCIDENNDDNQLMFFMIGSDDWYKQVDAILKPIVGRYCKENDIVIKW